MPGGVPPEKAVAQEAADNGDGTAAATPDGTFGIAPGEWARAGESLGAALRGEDRLDPAELLARLAALEDAAARGEPGYWAALLRQTAEKREQLAERARGTPHEGEALHRLSRNYAGSGRDDAWRGTFERYVEIAERQARNAAVAAGLGADEALRSGARAAAGAYHDEAKYLFEQGRHTAALALCDRLAERFPRAIKTYEAQIVAARCHLADHRPSGALEAYRRIVRDCPDERFARQAAKAFLQMLLHAGRGAELIAEGRRLRERFADDEFRAFTLFLQGEVLMRQGARGYPAALQSYREACALDPASETAQQATARLKRLQQWVLAQNADPTAAGADGGQPIRRPTSGKTGPATADSDQDAIGPRSGR